jgi:hypothetical protein
VPVQQNVATMVKSTARPIFHFIRLFLPFNLGRFR